MPELGQHARVASSSAAEGRTATSTKNTGSRSTSRWIGRSMQAAIVVLVVLLALSSDGVVKSVRATSTRLSPHKRAHTPEKISYTIVRRSDASSSALGLSAHSQRRLPSPSSSSSSLGSVGSHLVNDGEAHRWLGNRSSTEIGAVGLGVGLVTSKMAKKRSTLPAPFQVIDGTREKPLFDDTILLQLQVPPPSSSDASAELPERISILLRPTEHLLHPDARMVYTTVDPLSGQTAESVERLARENVLAYSGYVIHERDVPARLAEAKIGLRISNEEERSRGWARITFTPSQDQQNHLVLPEGAFQLDGELHHLKSLEKWQRSWSPDNHPRLASRQFTMNEGVVLLRDRDLEHGAFNMPSHLDKRVSTASLSDDQQASCTHDALAFNADMEHPVYKTARQMAFEAEYGRKSSWLDSFMGITPESYHHFDRRQTGNDLPGGGNMSSNYINSIGSTTGCPKSAQVLYMGLAADCTYTANYGSITAAREQLLTNMNTVSALYQSTFNISLGVVELNVQDRTCPTSTNSSVPWNVGCSSSGSGSTLDLNGRLSAFSRWRSNKGGGDGAGLWHLLTACSTGSEVGVAWLGTLCKVAASGTAEGETTSGTGVTAITDREWQVMAHEIGHNYGAIHDCANGCTLTQPCCPLSRTSCNANANFIMSPVSEKNTTKFSQCTIGNVCSALGTTLNTTCLYTPGDRRVISLQQCGNGILEPGEECDPGSNRNSPCCDATTCKLKSGAVCDPGTSSCCTSSCQYAPSGQVCRPAVNDQCDIAETCTGSSGDCPEDKTKPDGTSCGDNGLACASGFCTSRDEQCKTLGGSMGITRACPNSGDSSCTVTCASPGSSLTCTILEGQSFVDGTPCGYGGRCQNGNCQSGSWQDTVSSWYRDNLRISIPVTVVGGIVILLILFGIIRCCIRGCAKGYKTPKAASSKYYTGPPAAAGANGYANGYANGNGNGNADRPMSPPSSMQQQQQQQQPQPQYAQPSYPPNYAQPQQPYPTYGGYQNGNGYQQNGYYR